MDIIVDEKWKISINVYQCPICDKRFSKKGISTHIWRTHTEEGKLHHPASCINHSSWNKGLKKETDERIARQSLAQKEGFKNGSIKPAFLGKKETKEHRDKISASMKKAHHEGRAWNIGKSRWNNKPSYPETFFMTVIANEFEDKNYIFEYPVSIYSLDFAWPHKMKAIEIDGDQHIRFEDYKARDERKMQTLVEQGWTVLRIRWIDMFKNPKKNIQKAKEFIHS